MYNFKRPNICLFRSRKFMAELQATFKKKVSKFYSEVL